MRCKKVRLKIDAYIAGTLSPQAHAAFAEHLKACDGCRRAAEAVRKLTELGRAGAVPPVPEGFAQRLAVLARRRTARRVPAAAGWSLVAWWRMVSMPMRAVATAVLVIGLAAGAVLSWNTWQTPTTPTAQTAPQSDPLAPYNVDYLTDAPDGSLAQTYLALVSGPTQ
jgi:anti-sigma factor RsiW